jgi:hypothetical protein
MKTLAVLVVLLESTVAFAQPELRLSVGAGAAAAYHDPCGYGAEADCMGERVRISGAAPLVLAGVRTDWKLSENWRWRLGANASALLIANGTSSNVMTGAGEIGLERGRIAFDLIMGVSRLSVVSEEADVHANGATMMFGMALTARISPTLALFGRLDAHAMMHAPTGGVFGGAGLEWTPKY